MRKDDLISVVIPVYQDKKTIEKSICNTSCKNLEIIIVYRADKDTTHEKNSASIGTVTGTLFQTMHKKYEAYS